MRYYAPSFLFRRFEILRRVTNGDTFLEIGPGNLNLAVDLLRRFDRGVLVELNPHARHSHNSLEYALRSRLDLVLADFSELPTKTNQYDCVIACEVLEHVADEEAFLAKAVSALRPGGQLVLSVPARMGRWNIDDEVAGHYRRYERASFIALMQRCGLVDITITGYGFPLVNALRVPRLFLARLEYREMVKLSQKQRTETSSQITRGGLWKLLPLIVNPCTFYPLVTLTMFLDPLSTALDVSDGYVVVARKQRVSSVQP